MSHVTRNPIPIAERFAHAALATTQAHPGVFGRLTLARIIGGHPLPRELAARTRPSHQVESTWKLREIVCLIDALVAGGLLHTSDNHHLRPTNAGERALHALEGLLP